MSTIAKSPMFWSIVFITGFLSFVLYSQVILNLGDREFGTENEGNSFANILGSTAFAFLILGSTYLIFKWIYVYSQSINDEKQSVFKKMMNQLFMQFRAPFLTFHSIVMIIATGFGLIHGLYYLTSLDYVELSGWITAIIMVIMSVSGFLIYRQIESNKTLTSFLKIIHNRIISTVILTIVLTIHLITAI